MLFQKTKFVISDILRALVLGISFICFVSDSGESGDMNMLKILILFAFGLII